MSEMLIALYLTIFSDNFICKKGQCYMVKQSCTENSREYFTCSVHGDLGKRTYESGDYIPIQSFSVEEAWRMRGDK